MKNRDFLDLVMSIKEAARIRRGEMKLRRSFELRATDARKRHPTSGSPAS